MNSRTRYLIWILSGISLCMLLVGCILSTTSSFQNDKYIKDVCFVTNSNITEHTSNDDKLKGIMYCPWWEVEYKINNENCKVKSVDDCYLTEYDALERMNKFRINEEHKCHHLVDECSFTSFNYKKISLVGSTILIIFSVSLFVCIFFTYIYLKWVSCRSMRNVSDRRLGVNIEERI